MITLDYLIDCVKKNILNQFISRKILEFENIYGASAKTYLWTNEDIGKYSGLCKDNNYNSILCVTASGDQILNFIHNGITYIETFDINYVAKYVLELKLAMIIKYNYDEFIRIWNKLINNKTSLNEYTIILTNIIKDMDKESKYFWHEIIEYNYQLQKDEKHKINLINLICTNTSINFNNNYLNNEEEYNILKKNISNIKINYNRCNAYDLSNTYKDKFDIIYLSNILDYFYRCVGYKWKYDTLIEFTNNLNNISSKDGIIYLNYIFYYLKSYPLIRRSDIYLHNLDEQLDVVKHYKSDDAVLIKRKW